MSTSSEQLIFAFVPLCFGGFFLLAGAILLFFAIRTRRKSNASMAWPSTTGQISTASVRQNSSTDEDGHVNFTYSPVVEYDFSVNGQAFKGRRINYGITASPTKEAAQKEVDRFSVGRQVTVFYNPEKPGEAVLEKKVVTSKVGLILGSVFMALTLCTCCISMVMVYRGLAGG
jgi:hypothetical protein